MKLVTILQPISRSVALAAFCTCLPMVIGCDGKDSSESTRPARDMSPQAKYERVIAEIERILSADPKMTGGRHVLPSEAGSATTMTRYIVAAPETILIPKDGTAPRARVDITQKSSYSFLPAVKKEDEEGQEPAPETDDPLGEMGTNLKEMGVEVLDPEKVRQDLEKAAKARIKLPAVMQSVDTEKQITYDLIYENERWRLAGPPAADAMQSTNIAIQQALQRQL